MDYKELAAVLIGLQDADLELRGQLIQIGKLGEGYNEEMASLHRQNAEILDGIIDKIGYPTVGKVGEEANKAAWLVIQHAIGQPHFMRKCSKLLEEALHENQADIVNLAYLTDRIAVFENKPQLYGTQFDWDQNGQLSPNYFDDLGKVNQRRNSLGLNSLEEQTELIRNQAKTENQSPPQDFELRKIEIEKWKKSVGWVE
ncbi:hypothetical protein MM213_02710 [Belliella sp. R4-6]|uniref:Uncharacterized protein n=1 Tax=Belliella alkalica TaxID=1730871 RepID=A0ABS9V7I2_9BACT|nr:DUF6624 domain-containing protein [Belliella alkalica]MCH7412381.1 hypothetical protein [Belliella alkalica]